MKLVFKFLIWVGALLAFYFILFFDGEYSSVFLLLANFIMFAAVYGFLMYSKKLPNGKSLKKRKKY